MTGFEIALLAGLIFGWGAVSPDRVASPGRAALKAGGGAAARSGWGSAKSAWQSGGATRSARQATRRGWLGGLRMPFGRRAKDAEGNRTGDRRTLPVGSWANRFVDGAQAVVFGAARAGWGATRFGVGATREGVAAGRDGWREGRERHQEARELGEKSRWGMAGGIVRDTVRPPEGRPINGWRQRIKDCTHDLVRCVRPRQDEATGCVWCGRETADWALDSGEPVCDACLVRHERESGEHLEVLALVGRERRDRDAYDEFAVENFISDEPSEPNPPAPSGADSTTPAPTQKENPVANPTGQLDINDINDLKIVADALATASEIATQMAGHAATARGLRDAIGFDPGGDVFDQVDALSEVTPPATHLVAWAEAVGNLKRSVDARIAGLAEGLDGAKGHTDQLTPA